MAAAASERLPAIRRARTSAGDWHFTDAEGHGTTIDNEAGIRLRADTVDVLVESAVAGAGVTLGPDFSFAASLDCGALERVLPEHTTTARAIHVVYPAARHVSKRLRCFIDMLTDWSDRYG